MGLSPRRRARLLEVTQGRSGGVYADWLASRPKDWRDQIRVAALDPFRGYLDALRAHLPNAAHVLDAFHVSALGMKALDEVRRRVQPPDPASPGGPGSASPPLSDWKPRWPPVIPTGRSLSGAAQQLWLAYAMKDLIAGREHADSLIGKFVPSWRRSAESDTGIDGSTTTDCGYYVTAGWNGLNS